MEQFLSTNFYSYTPYEVLLLDCNNDISSVWGDFFDSTGGKQNVRFCESTSELSLPLQHRDRCVVCFEKIPWKRLMSCDSTKNSWRTEIWVTEEATVVLEYQKKDYKKFSKCFDELCLNIRKASSALNVPATTCIGYFASVCIFSHTSSKICTLCNSLTGKIDTDSLTTANSMLMAIQNSFQESFSLTNACFVLIAARTPKSENLGDWSHGMRGNKYLWTVWALCSGVVFRKTRSSDFLNLKTQRS